MAWIPSAMAARSPAQEMSLLTTTKPQKPKAREAGAPRRAPCAEGFLRPCCGAERGRLLSWGPGTMALNQNRLRLHGRSSPPALEAKRRNLTTIHYSCRPSPWQACASSLEPPVQVATPEARPASRLPPSRSATSGRPLPCPTLFIEKIAFPPQAFTQARRNYSIPPSRHDSSRCARRSAVSEGPIGPCTRGRSPLGDAGPFGRSKKLSTNFTRGNFGGAPLRRSPGSSSAVLTLSRRCDHYQPSLRPRRVARDVRVAVRPWASPALPPDYSKRKKV